MKKNLHRPPQTQPAHAVHQIAILIALIVLMAVIYREACQKILNSELKILICQKEN